MSDNKILVSRSWYEDIVKKVNLCTTCPFCGSANLLTTTGDDIFMPQRGCLDCEEWFTKPELKK
jgi:hypothetical protein